MQVAGQVCHCTAMALAKACPFGVAVKRFKAPPTRLQLDETTMNSLLPRRFYYLLLVLGALVGSLFVAATFFFPDRSAERISAYFILTMGTCVLMCNRGSTDASLDRSAFRRARTWEWRGYRNRTPTPDRAAANRFETRNPKEPQRGRQSALGMCCIDHKLDFAPRTTFAHDEEHCPRLPVAGVLVASVARGPC